MPLDVEQAEHRNIKHLQTLQANPRATHNSRALQLGINQLHLCWFVGDVRDLVVRSTSPEQWGSPTAGPGRAQTSKGSIWTLLFCSENRSEAARVGILPDGRRRSLQLRGSHGEKVSVSILLQSKLYCTQTKDGL